jgi:GNAT superfamily N-acetyltransferase
MTITPSFLDLSLLTQHHDCSAFDCGIDVLNTYLKKYALQHHQGQGARTYVATHQNTVVGYFTLAYGSVSTELAPQRVSQGLGPYPIPVMVLARLAVDIKFKGKGLGRALLKHSLLKTLNAAEFAGLRAVTVHAKDPDARSFYEHFGFMPSPSDEFHMFLLCKDILRDGKE